MSDPEKLTPSIIDVLAYSNRSELEELIVNPELVRRQVHRNLENLLNCRRRPKLPPKHLENVGSSIALFGIPDFTANGFDSDRQRRWLCNEIRRAIRTFEPRLKKVVVEDLNDPKQLDRLLRFRISAELQVYPNPHRIVFDSRLDRATCLFTVQAT